MRYLVNKLLKINKIWNNRLKLIQHTQNSIIFHFYIKLKSENQNYGYLFT